jgi:monofunctional biosynthetic peptidoglycan transglycosylase
VLKKTFKWSLGCAFFLVFGVGLHVYLSLPDVRELKTRNPETTALIEQRIREAQKSGRNINIRMQWVEFDRIPKLLKDAVRVSEDAAFYQHGGIDFNELKEAVKKNWQAGRYVRGGSTITQQLAKNLYLSTQKSILRKIKEYFIARRLEAHLGKERIFSLYLNIIELGPGIYGVQAASRFYFKKDVVGLNLDEIVRLTAIIPRPLKTDPLGKNRWLKWKATWILDALKRYEYISQEEHQTAVRRFQRN